MTETTEGEKRGWFQRLRSGLSRSSSRIGDSITGLFTKRKLDKALLDELEEAQQFLIDFDHVQRRQAQALQLRHQSQDTPHKLPELGLAR